MEPSQKVLEIFVATVAEGLLGGMLAAAEIDRLRFCGLVLHRSEIGAFVTAVAERLLSALAAGAPEVTLACFHFYRIRTFLSDCRF